MTRMQRDKGRRGELEALDLLGEYGIAAARVHGQEEIGGGLGDLDSDVGRWEIKRRACLPAWMQLAEQVRGVLVRGDRGRWCVLLRADDALDLIRRDREARAQKLAAPKPELPAAKE